LPLRGLHALLLALVFALACTAIDATAQKGSRQGAGGFNRGGGQDFPALMDQGREAFRNRDMAAAEDAVRQAISIAERSGAERRLGPAYGLLGNVLAVRGKYAEAEPVLRKAIALLEQEFGPSGKTTLGTLIWLGHALRGQGRLAEAVEIARETLKRQSELTPPPHQALVPAYILYGDLMQALHRAEDAESAYLSAIESGKGSRRPEHLRRLAGAHNHLAGSYALRGKFDAAESQARLALATAEQAHDSDSRDALAANVRLGWALFAQGKDEEAEKALARAAAGEKTLGRDSPDASRLHEVLGQVHEKHGRYAEADAEYRKSIEVEKRSGGEFGFVFRSTRYARFLINRGRERDALEQYRGALDAIDRLFASTRGLDEETRQGFIAQYVPYYYATVRLLLTLHQSQKTAGHDREALAVVSRTQSRMFTEMLRQADVGKFAGSPQFQALKAEREAALRSINDQRRVRAVSSRDSETLEDESDAPRRAIDPLIQARIDQHRADLGERLAESGQKLKAIEDRLWRDYPRYMELIAPRPVTVQDLQQRLLRPGETVLCYFLLPQAAAVFVVSRERFSVHLLPQKREEVVKLVRAARRAEEQAATSISTLSKLEPEVLNRLYEILIKPIEASLPKDGRILVVGDSALLTLPLEMLVTHYSAEDRKRFEAERQAGKLLFNEYATLSYLGERFQFAYLPSLSALASQRSYAAPRSAFDRNLVSFADPVFEREGGAQARAPAADAALRSLLGRGANERISIQRLPETADEARDIASAVGEKTDVFLRDRAQESSLKAADLKSTRFLHFATHGLLGAEFLQLKLDAIDDVIDAASEGPLRSKPAGGRPVANAQAATPAGPARAPIGQPALVLSRVGELKGEDGLLTMREVIEDLNLNAELVVLSACNTAGESDEAYNGEGFAGLTRAFMFAGARGLVVSHWAVESLSTKQLMTQMFRHLAQGNDATTALGKARENIRATPLDAGGQRYSRAHPYFWAPFVYVGD
jgi:CHAT domain-containing protein/Flp pilus assembly protein TadD